MIFKLEILKEDYLRTNSFVGFFDPLSRSSGMGLGLGTSHIKTFFILFQNNEYFSFDIAHK
jgi:hypothetical protein